MGKPTEDAQIMVCQGPPRCAMTGDDAVVAQMAGCPWCEVITIASDGREFRRGPSDDAARQQEEGKDG